MKLDPGMHIIMHLVFFGKSGVTGWSPLDPPLDPPLEMAVTSSITRYSSTSSGSKEKEIGPTGEAWLPIPIRN
jgi:hypothetical protein